MSQPTRILTLLCALLLAVPVLAAQARAQTANPFAPGWRLDPEASELRFVSIKNGDLAEANRFGTLSGLITDQGRAQIRILLDSVDTGIDLRNVRLRFMLFETFLHPEAIVTTQLDPTRLRDLADRHRVETELNYALSLHGMTLSDRAKVAVTPLGPDRVMVSSTAPIPVSATKFGMGAGITKLQEAAEVAVVPVAVVSFDLVFDRGAPEASSAPPVASGAAPGPAAAQCTARLAEASDGIAFAPASARLTQQSTAALDRVAEIARACPGPRLRIAGHTDSDGDAQANLRLSQARAEAVAAALASRGIARDRLTAEGHGEAEPRVPNTSAANKALNRRIEVSVLR